MRVAVRLLAQSAELIAQKGSAGFNLSSEILGFSAPALRFYVCDGLGKVPVMPMEIACVVLALAIDVIHRFGQDGGATPAGSLAMRMGVFNAHLDDARAIRRHVALGNCETALAGAHLDSVIGNPEPNRKPEGFRQPLRGDTWIRIDDNGDYGAGRDRAVIAHATSLGANLRSDYQEEGIRADRAKK